MPSIAGPGADPQGQGPAPVRCSWATGVEMTSYHDLEWGTPVHDDHQHFELLTFRHRQKITSTITNAAALAAMQDGPGGFDAWIWDFVGGSTVVGGWRSTADVPASTALSVRLSTELRRRGFRFVGPTVCYSYLEAAGLVNDHVVDCYRYAELLPGDAATPE